MSRIEFASDVAYDIDRIVDHLIHHDVDNAASRVEAIVHAINVLESNPLIGRPAPGDMRELVIGRRSRGYIALYRYIAEIDTVFVLALRSQVEAGYRQR